MKTFAFAVLAVSIAAAMGPALAAESYSDSASGTARDWSGFYAGVMGTGVATNPDALIGLGGIAGINAGFDFALIGAEIAVIGLRDTGTGVWQAQAQLLARGGVIVGDDVLIYGAGGYGAELTGTGETFGLFGGGIEVAFSETLSFRGQYLYASELSGGADQQQVSLSTLFHF